MVKVATVRKAESEREKAADHIKNTVIFPSALMGLISIVLGYGAVIYLIFKGGHFTNLAVDSFVLVGVGVLLALFQCLYHRFLFDKHPEYYAQQRRRSEMLRARNIRKIEIVSKPAHPGKWMVPLFYLMGLMVMVAMVMTYIPRLNPLSAIFLLLAGFYNLRFFFWKRKLKI